MTQAPQREWAQVLQQQLDDRENQVATLQDQLDRVNSAAAAASRGEQEQAQELHHALSVAEERIRVSEEALNSLEHKHIKTVKNTFKLIKTIQNY